MLNSRTRTRVALPFGVFALRIALLHAAACVNVQAAETVDYTRDVRPILAENCFFCHGQDEEHREADIRLDTLEGQRDSGAVEPGDLESSMLVMRIQEEDPDFRMPPADSNRQLTDQQIDVLVRWVEQGAPFEGHWAFQPLVAPDVPQIESAQQPVNPIDAFLQARLGARDLAPSPEASRETLIRRASLDLIGLPPTPAEVEAFLSDDSPDAYEKVVDRLLADAHYGERMAWPWLDAARYADSNGFQQDGDTFQWVWRDWVVRALNDNMPFDQFTIEQLAGDLIPDATMEQKIATAFNRNHMLNGEGGAIPEEQRHVILFDRIDVTATVWLGLTMACAQCHDHKYDPITQRDYYRLMDAFNNIPEDGVVPGKPFHVRLADPILDVASDEQKEHLAQMYRRIDELKDYFEDQEAAKKERIRQWADEVAKLDDFEDREILKLARQSDDEARYNRDSKLQIYFAQSVAPSLADDPAAELIALQREAARYSNDQYPRVMVMEETKPRETFILDRGNYDSPLDKVEFNTPGFLPPLPEGAPRNRLGLAQWLVSDANPLTARVIVNRQWQIFFGQGLVKTSEDFGVQSDPPVHRELLDWLAVHFRETGWDVKRLHKLIVMSDVYRQSSHITPKLLEVDPENRLYARGARFRLPAMLLRDQALAVSGLLNDEIGGRPVYPYQPDYVWDSLNITKERNFEYPHSSGADLWRRSLYTFWRRTVAPINMFDASSRNICKVRLPQTNTPLHALVTLNDPTFVEAARALASRALHHCSDPAKQVSFAMRRVLCRAPRDDELATLVAALENRVAEFAKRPEDAEALLSVGASPRDPAFDPVEHAAMTTVCLTILNLDEALTRE